MTRPQILPNTDALDIVNNRVGQEIFRMDYAMWDRIVITIGTNRYRAVGDWLSANDPDTYAPIAGRVIA